MYTSLIHTKFIPIAETCPPKLDTLNIENAGLKFYLDVMEGVMLLLLLLKSISFCGRAGSITDALVMIYVSCLECMTVASG